MNPTLLVILVLVIGIVVGVGAVSVVKRPSWFTRQIAPGRRAELTSGLVGIAGAFIGFHVGALLSFDSIVLLVCAVIGAALVVWGWREVRI
jgi:uncharacterized membrane protein YeaQ/YmgE (transglycosylase-associated protein family)